MISPKEQFDSHSFSKAIQKCISLRHQQHEHRNIPSKYIKISALDDVSHQPIITNCGKHFKLRVDLCKRFISSSLFCHGHHFLSL